MNDLTLIDDKYDANLAKMMGFGGPSGQTEDSLPVLRINPDFVVERELDDGTKEDVNVVPGCFKVYKDGEQVYSMKNPVFFRVFMQRFDFREYDESANEGKGEYVKNSILINQGEEPIDDFGTIACGKVRGKAAKGDLSDAQKLIQKAVQSYRVVFGTVTFKGVTVSGKEVDVVDYPVQMRLRGTNFMALGDTLKEFEKLKVLPLFYELQMTTTRHTKGATKYYVIAYSWDKSKRLKVGQPEMELSRQFLDHIKAYNEPIIEKHKAALAARSKPTSVAEDTGLDEDFGEEEGSSLDD